MNAASHKYITQQSGSMFMALSGTAGNSVLISSQKPFTIFYELKSTVQMTVLKIK